MNHLQQIQTEIAPDEAQENVSETTTVTETTPTTAEVEAESQSKKSTRTEKRKLILAEPEPWPEPVDGEVLMDGLIAELKTYLALPEGSAEAIALWCIFSHALDAFFYSPRLFFSSPEKQCGKSTALKIVQKLCWRPLLAANISSAAIYRAVEAYQPTLLLDEADTFIKSNEDLRGVLNSGHDRETACVIRCEGEKNEPRAYTTWAAYAIAGIGRIPDTLEDRSVIVHMRRKLEDEKLSALRPHKADRLNQLAQMIRRWADDNFDILKQADPDLPNELSGRAGDNWLPLLAIADTIGGEWPLRTRNAGIALLQHELTDDSSIGVQLLVAIKTMFAEEMSVRLGSQEMCDWLIEQEGPWAEWGAKGKPISPIQLAYQLKKYGILSNSHRFPSGVKRGYELEQFEDAFARYLPNPENKCDMLQPSITLEESVAVTDGVADRNATCYQTDTPNPRVDQGCSVVAGFYDDADA